MLYVGFPLTDLDFWIWISQPGMRMHIQPSAQSSQGDNVSINQE